MTQEPTASNVTDFHREVSLMLLRSTSAFAVRTPRGQKDPGSIQWDPKTNNREKSLQTIKALETTNDNLGIHLFGNVVDVDIDTDNPVMFAALDYFLPKTAHIWGRPSRPRTHRLYEIGGVNQTYNPADYPFLAKIQAVPEINVEVRGGEQKSGQYSLLAGSMHPSGEYYEWHDVKSARQTPTQVNLERLMEGVRLACVSALIVPYWVEGMRNEMCKALCGFMYRASRYSVELNSDMPFGFDVAQKLMEGIMSLADDDPADYAMRIRTLEQTWKKGDEGQPIVGATKITEVTGNPDLLKLLYVLLAHTADAQALDQLFEQYVVLRNTTNVVDLDLGARGNYVMHKEAFGFTLAGRFITTQSGRVPVANIFVNSLQRTIVDRIGVDPAQPKVYVDEHGQKCANIWSGWGIPPCEEHVTDDEVSWFTDYIMTVLSRGDEGLARWIIMWVADIFQNPSDKAGTMLVLVGEQGAGKSFLCENVLRPIIGDAHMIKVSSIEKLTSKFNAHMSGKILIQGEEVLNSNRKADADTLKDMITSKRRTIEFKGRDTFEQEDHARYVLTSNHIDNAVAVGRGDRRSTIAHVSDSFAYMGGANAKQQATYWGRMYKIVEEKDYASRTVPHKANLAKLHKWLLQVEIERQVIRVSHDTEIKRVTRNNSSRGIDAWLISLIEMENPFDNMREQDRGDAHSFVYTHAGARFVLTRGWPTHVQYSKLEQAYKQASSRDHSEQKTAQQIAKFFKDNKMVRDTMDSQTRANGERIRVRPFPSREEIIKYLTKSGYSILDVTPDSTAHIPDVDDQDGGPKF